MKKILLVAMIMTGMSCLAQQDSAQVKAKVSPLTFSAYVEGYYSYDFNKPANNNKPAFLYNHNRQNEFNINLAFIRGSYAGDKARGTIAISAGSYMNSNYGAEAGTLKNIYEANAGLKIGKKNFWFDIGILPSHIGFESAIGKDCWTLTRSLVAENSPYFQAGARLGYTSDNGKWFLSGLLLNGWQRITRVEGNSKMSFGTQVTYKPSTAVTINYSSFIGTDKPDSARLNRVYHNMYGIFQLGSNLGITAGFDIGSEQKTTGSNKSNIFYSPVFVAKYMISERLAVSARGEYYKDAKGVIIFTGTQNGFRTTGVSLNIDYLPTPNILFRMEGRLLNSKDKIFTKKKTPKNSNAFFTTSLAVSF